MLDELVFTSLEKVDNEAKAMIVANVCFSLHFIVMAAKKVQARLERKDDKLVNQLKFRRKWIQCWLRQQAMLPRRGTAQAQAKELVQA